MSAADHGESRLPTCVHERTDKDCAACVWRLHKTSQQRDHEHFAAVLTSALRYVEAGDGHGPVVLREALATLDRSDMVLSRTLDRQGGTINGLRDALRDACADGWADGPGAERKYLAEHGVMYVERPRRDYSGRDGL